MEFAGQLKNPATVLARFQSLAVVMLMRFHKSDSFLAMPAVISVYKFCNAQAVLFLACERLARIIRQVFNNAE